MSTTEELTWIEIIRSKPRGEDLPLRPNVCSNCPVAEGMWKEISDAYKDLPVDERLKLSKSWFCHCSPGKACRGHANNIEAIW